MRAGIHTNLRLRFRSAATAALILIVFPACDFLESDCFDDVKMSVGSSATPEFSWQPRCAVRALWVLESGSDTLQWLVEGEFKPPVRYAIRPPGAKTLERPQPLQYGITYSVHVIGGGAYGVREIGSHEFTFTPVDG